MSLILIADDNPHAHRMGRQILSQEGHEVVTVSNGDEALQYLEHSRPDLIMADTRMPGPNGYEVCREVKHSGRFDGVSVVLLAGPLEPFDSDQAQSSGSDAVLHKPLDAYSLIETINTLLGKTPQNQTMEHETVEHETAEPPEPAVIDGPDEDVQAAGQSIERLVAVAEDPFEELVEQALGRTDGSATREIHVRAAVAEALESSLPALVDTITERVLAKLNESG